MEKELLTYLFTNISFGTLFVWLLISTTKKSDERELRYQNTIESLANVISVDVKNVKDDIDDIKSDIKNINNKIK